MDQPTTLGPASELGAEVGAAHAPSSREARKQEFMLARLAAQEEQRVRAARACRARPLRHARTRPSAERGPVRRRAPGLSAAQLRQTIRAALKSKGLLSAEDEALLAAHPAAADEERQAIERGREKKLRDEERTAEVEDSEADIREKVVELAALLKAAKHVVVYTGAGLSTAAQIPDYRGPQVCARRRARGVPHAARRAQAAPSSSWRRWPRARAPRGAQGVWTLQKRGGQASMPIEYEETRPTAAHMALRALVRTKRVRHVVSQNVDGLHRRSGMPATSLTELHGNIFLEQCVRCGKRYLRPFHVTDASSYHHHQTPRKCAAAKCAGAQLRDTIVYFGEKLHDADLERARAESAKADLAIFLGSSLKVLQHYKFIWERPRDKQKRFVIVNLQWTPKDRTADLKINGRCDAVLGRLLAALKLKLPAYSEHHDPIAALAKITGAKAVARGAAATAASGGRAPKSRAFPTVVRRSADERPMAAEAAGNTRKRQRRR